MVYNLTINFEITLFWTGTFTSRWYKIIQILTLCMKLLLTQDFQQHFLSIFLVEASTYREWCFNMRQFKGNVVIILQVLTKHVITLLRNSFLKFGRNYCFAWLKPLKWNEWSEKKNVGKNLLVLNSNKSENNDERRTL